MKFLVLLLSYALAANIIVPKDSDEALSHLQGNNFNTYIVYFYQSSTIDKEGMTINNLLN